MTQRWTIRVCPVCGFMDPDQYEWGDRQRVCPFAARGGGTGDGKHPYRGDRDYDPYSEYVEVVVEEACAMGSNG
jgi:hypothetical protein